MKTATDSRIPVSKFAWPVLIVFLAGPLLFFALVTPQEKPAEAPRTVELPPSKLAAVGLRENRDWDGLPEIFAVWADNAYWQNNRTRFAWWNPGTDSYSYFFEAHRTPAGIRFREVKEPREAGFEWDRDVADGSPLRLYLPIRARPEDPVAPLNENATRKVSPPKRD